MKNKFDRFCVWFYKTFDFDPIALTLGLFICLGLAFLFIFLITVLPLLVICLLGFIALFTGITFIFTYIQNRGKNIN